MNKIKLLEITTMILWAGLRGFEEVEPANQADCVILRGGGSGFSYVEYSEAYEIVLSPGRLILRELHRGG